MLLAHHLSRWYRTESRDVAGNKAEKKTIPSICFRSHHLVSSYLNQGEPSITYQECGKNRKCIEDANPFFRANTLSSLVTVGRHNNKELLNQLRPLPYPF